MMLSRRQWFHTVILAPVLAAVAPYLPAPVKKALPFDFDPVLIRLITHPMPSLSAYDICNVQPMSGPTGLVFSMKTGKQIRSTDSVCAPLWTEEHRLRPEPGMLVD